MGEVVQESCVSRREWRLECYDADGGVTQCVIDTDHGDLRIGLTGALEKFFELRADQVGKFRVAFDKAIMANRTNTGGESSHQQQWLLHCYSNYHEPRTCVIRIRDGTLQITCADILTGTHDCFLELRAEQIGKFRTALNTALDVVRTDRTIYGTGWADDEQQDDNPEGLPPLGDDTQFTSQINTMVTEEAPRMFALVEEIKDRADAVIIAWGMAFPDHVEIMSAGRGRVRGMFNSAQRAQQLFSVCNPIRLVWVSTPLTHYPAQATS